jgi:hypothetical protein
VGGGKNVPARLPFFGVLPAGKAAGTNPENSNAEESFRTSEPAMHNEWEFTETVKHTYEAGAKQRLAKVRFGSITTDAFSARAD